MTIIFKNISIAVLCQLCGLFQIFSLGEARKMLHCHDDRTGKQQAVISPVKNLSFVCIVTTGLLKGKILLVVVDAHNHKGDFSSMISMTIRQTETALLPFGY